MEVEVWPASQIVWLAGAGRRRTARILAAILLISGAMTLYLWSVAPFGGPSSFERYLWTLLELLYALLLSLGFVTIVWTFTAAYPERITIATDGIRVHQRSARTGRSLPYEPDISWNVLARTFRFIERRQDDQAQSDAGLLTIERSRLTWGGLTRADLEAIMALARERGYALSVRRDAVRTVYTVVRAPASTSS